MSPEQACGDKSIDARSDQYSLAVVGYRMLAGELPFEGESTRAVLYQQLVAEPPPIATKVPGVPSGLASAIQRAMAKEPSERFANMAEFAAMLDSEGLGTGDVRGDCQAGCPKRDASVSMAIGGRRRRGAGARRRGSRPGHANAGRTATAGRQPARRGRAAAGHRPRPPPPSPPVDAAARCRAQAAARRRRTPADEPGDDASKQARRRAGPPPPPAATTTASCAKLAAAANWAAAAAGMYQGSRGRQRRGAATARHDVRQGDRRGRESDRRRQLVSQARPRRDVEAQFLLSHMLETGRGTRAQRRRIDRCCCAKRPPAAGCVRSRRWPIASRTGSGIKKDETEAAIWYRRAAERGDVISQREARRIPRQGPRRRQERDRSARLVSQGWRPGIGRRGVAGGAGVLQGTRHRQGRQRRHGMAEEGRGAQSAGCGEGTEEADG